MDTSREKAICVGCEAPICVGPGCDAKALDANDWGTICVARETAQMGELCASHLYTVRRTLPCYNASMGREMCDAHCLCATHISTMRRKTWICIAPAYHATHISRVLVLFLMFCVILCWSCDANRCFASLPCLCDANKGTQIVLFLLVGDKGSPYLKPF